jgi:hypothetical protein
MLLLFYTKLVKLKTVWLARILEIDLFGDGGIVVKIGIGRSRRAY